MPNKLLKLVVNGDVVAGELQTCAVQPSFGIKLPTGSLDTDDARLQFQFTDASLSAAVPYAQIAQSPPLGLHGASVAFDPALPNASSEISLAFKSTLELHAGDTVVLVLPGFAGATKTAGQMTAPMLGGTDVDKFSASGSTWDEVSKALTLALNGGFAAASLATVTLLAPAGVKLPSGATALAANRPELALGFGAVARSLEPVAVTSSLQAASLRNVSLSYPAPHAVIASEFTLMFSNQRTMANADYLEVVMHQFGGSPKAATTIQAPMLAGASAGNFDANACSWTQSSDLKTLRLSVNGAVASYLAQTVVVGAAVGITLPSGSLDQDQPALTIKYIDANNPSNSIPAASIAQSPAMGLYSTSLAYSARSPDPSTVAVGFKSTVPLSAGSSVVVELSGFTGATKTAGQISAGALSGPIGPSFDTGRCSWTGSTNRLLTLVLDSPPQPRLGAGGWDGDCVGSGGDPASCDRRLRQPEPGHDLDHTQRRRRIDGLRGGVLPSRVRRAPRHKLGVCAP